MTAHGEHRDGIMQPKRRRGAPKGHPPYRPAVLTLRLQIPVSPAMKERIDAAADLHGVHTPTWCRMALETQLQQLGILEET